MSSVLPHDILINGVGYMLDRPGGALGVTVQDLGPASSRAVDGEADFIRFEPDSAHAIADWSGGAGQARRVAANAYLTGKGDGSWEGHFYPPYASAAVDTGFGATERFYRVGSNLHHWPADQRPLTDGNGNAWYTSGGSVFRTTSEAAGTNVTPTGYTAKGASPFGRHVFCFVEHTLPATPAVVQSETDVGTAGQLFMSWAAQGRPGSVYVAIVAFNSFGATVGNVPSFVIPATGGWVEVGTVTSSAALANSLRYKVFLSEQSLIDNLPGTTKPRERTGRWGLEGFTVVSSGTSRFDGPCFAYMAELEGVKHEQYGAAFLDFKSDTKLASTALATGTATGTGASDLRISVMGYSDDVSNADVIGHAANWTEVVEQAFGTSTGLSRVAIATSTQANSDSATLAGARDALAGCVLALDALGTAIARETILATSDEGTSWLYAPQDFSTRAIGTPRMFLPAKGSLWFTTQYGLYAMTYAENEFNTGQRTINIAVVQMAAFESDDANNGMHLALFDGALFYNCAGALYRFTTGGGHELVWPTPGWATAAGPVTAICSIPGGLAFSVGTSCWKFNGLSFHDIATFTGTPSDLYYHAAAIHYGVSTAHNRIQCGNTAIRPDISGSGAVHTTGGGVVSSRLDFHKVNVTKLIKVFEGQIRGSGTTALEYAIANGAADPGVHGGIGTGSGVTWTAIGNLTTNLPTTFVLTDAVAAKAIWLRALLASTSILVYQSAVGRSVMPLQRRFSATLQLQSGLRSKSGTVLYPTQTEVAAALAALKALRVSQASFDIIYDDGGGTGETVEVTMSSLSYQQLEDRGDGTSATNRGLYLQAVATFDELPTS